MIENPKVFIHYSWDSEAHKDWVFALADRLISDGIDLIFDRYDLKLGSNSNYFMEKVSISAKTILIMTPAYKIKADHRSSGVGYEFQMIVSELSQNLVSNSKYIPVLRAGQPSESIPQILQSYIHLDMREDHAFESQYMDLLKNLYDQPIVKRPALGKRPDFINMEENLREDALSIVPPLGTPRDIVHKILDEPENSNGLNEEYWSHGLILYYNKHSDKVDGQLARRQPSGVTFEDTIYGIKLGESFAQVKSRLGNPLNWGLPSNFTSYAVYKIEDKFLTLAIWRDIPDRDYADFKIGTIYAIAYCEAYSVLACEPIVTATIQEIRSGKKLTYLERDEKDYDINLRATFFNDDYSVISIQPFIFGGYTITVIFEGHEFLLDFWIYDLSWSELVIRMVTSRQLVDQENK